MGVRNWPISELARRAKITQPEMSRVVSGVRTPSLRHIVGIAEAFSSSVPRETDGPLVEFEMWAGKLVRLGYDARGEEDGSVRKMRSLEEVSERLPREEV